MPPAFNQHKTSDGLLKPEALDSLLGTTGDSGEYAFGEVDLATLAKTYRRDHSVDAVYDVNGKNYESFKDQIGDRFSRFKHGDARETQFFAEQIAQKIFKQFLSELRHNSANFKIVAPAYKGAPTSAVLLAENVCKILEQEYSIVVEQVYLDRRVTSQNDFGKLKTHEERMAKVFHNFKYEGESLNGKTLLFMEDALVSGAHYQESQRVLVEEAGAKLEDVHGYFIVNVDGASFESLSLAAEYALNHVWIAPEHFDRMTQMLKEPDTQFTPRSLKFILDRDWGQVEAALNQLDLRTILGIQHFATCELGSKEKYKPQVAKLEDYANRTLKQAKQDFGLESSIKVNGDTLQEFRDTKVMFHPGLQQNLSFGDLYSLLKFGDFTAVNYFAEIIARDLLVRFEDNFDQGQWCLAAASHEIMSGSNWRLAERVASILGIPLVDIERHDTPPSSRELGLLNDVRKRFDYVKQAEFVLEGQVQPNLILFDIAVGTTASISKMYAAASPHCDRIVTHSLCDVATTDMTVMHQLNTNMVEAHSPMTLHQVVVDPLTKPLPRTTKAMLRLTPEQLEESIQDTPLAMLIEHQEIIHKFNLDVEQRFTNQVGTFIGLLNQRIRTEKGGNLPPYESHYIMGNNNVSRFIEEHGQKLARLRHADPLAIEYYAKQLTDTIRRRFGKRIAQNPDQYSVASGSYYRRPTSSTYLAQRVAELLEIPNSVDIRVKNSVGHGFSAIPDGPERRRIAQGNAYITNIKAVEGKNIIFIDDTIAAGGHLKDHHDVLIENGANQVLSFCTVDIATQDFSKDRLLNLAGIYNQSVEELQKLTQNPEVPFLPRTIKLLLASEPSSFKAFVTTLSNERVFELYESVQLEGHERDMFIDENLACLEHEAQKRDLESSLDFASIVTNQYSIMVFDYDDTLAPTLTPLSEQMCFEICYQLKRGTMIAIISAQKIGENGLAGNFLAPLREYLIASGESLDLLKQVYLLPEDGSSAYQPDLVGEIDQSQPEYNVNLQGQDAQQLRKIVIDDFGKTHATKIYDRPSYISLHFADQAKMLKAKQTLEGKLANFVVPMEVRIKKTNKPKYVLHIRKADLSKAVGRDFVLDKVRKRQSKLLGRQVERSEILVAGDKMGYGIDEDYDSHMYVLGGVNIALGKNSFKGAHRAWLGMLSKGTLNLLQSIRTQSQLPDDTLR